jgi:hypothetical protein
MQKENGHEQQRKKGSRQQGRTQKGETESEGKEKTEEREKAQ